MSLRLIGTNGLHDRVENREFKLKLARTSTLAKRSLEKKHLNKCIYFLTIPSCSNSIMFTKYAINGLEGATLKLPWKE